VEIAQAERIESNHFASHWDTMPPVNVASAMVEAGRLRLRRPVSSLRADLGGFWSIETTSAKRLRTLPDACATLSVESGQGIALKCFLVGPRQTPAEGAPPAGQTLFGVRLKPGVTFVLTWHTSSHTCRAPHTTSGTATRRWFSFGERPCRNADG
jgi:hypothetical protein